MNYFAQFPDNLPVVVKTDHIEFQHITKDKTTTWSVNLLAVEDIDLYQYSCDGVPYCNAPAERYWCTYCNGEPHDTEYVMLTALGTEFHLKHASVYVDKKTLVMIEEHPSTEAELTILSKQVNDIIKQKESTLSLITYAIESYEHDVSKLQIELDELRMMC